MPLGGAQTGAGPSATLPSLSRSRARPEPEALDDGDRAALAVADTLGRAHTGLKGDSRAIRRCGDRRRERRAPWRRSGEEAGGRR